MFKPSGFGGSGTDWRIHATHGLAGGRFSRLELTGAKGAVPQGAGDDRRPRLRESLGNRDVPPVPARPARGFIARTGVGFHRAHRLERAAAGNADGRPVRPDRGASSRRRNRRDPRGELAAGFLMLAADIPAGEICPEILEAPSLWAMLRRIRAVAAVAIALPRAGSTQPGHAIADLIRDKPAHRLVAEVGGETRYLRRSLTLAVMGLVPWRLRPRRADQGTEPLPSFPRANHTPRYSAGAPGCIKQMLLGRSGYD